MTEKRLNNCLLVHVHKDIVDELTLKEIAVEFVSVNDERRKHFGNYTNSLFLSTLMHLLHQKKVEKTYCSSYVFWDRVRARNSA